MQIYHCEQKLWIERKSSVDIFSTNMIMARIWYSKIFILEPFRDCKTVCSLNEYLMLLNNIPFVLPLDLDFSFFKYNYANFHEWKWRHLRLLRNNTCSAYLNITMDYKIVDGSAYIGNVWCWVHHTFTEVNQRCKLRTVNVMIRLV